MNYLLDFKLSKIASNRVYLVQTFSSFIQKEDF